MHLQHTLLHVPDVLLHAVGHVDSDDVGPGAGPPAEGAGPEVGVGVLAGVPDQGVLTAVGPGTLLAAEGLDGGGTCS